MEWLVLYQDLMNSPATFIWIVPHVIRNHRTYAAPSLTMYLFIVGRKTDLAQQSQTTAIWTLCWRLRVISTCNIASWGPRDTCTGLHRGHAWCTSRPWVGTDNKWPVSRHGKELCQLFYRFKTWRGTSKVMHSWLSHYLIFLKRMQKLYLLKRISWCFHFSEAIEAPVLALLASLASSAMRITLQSTARSCRGMTTVLTASSRINLSYWIFILTTP